MTATDVESFLLTPILVTPGDYPNCIRRYSSRAPLVGVAIRGGVGRGRGRRLLGALTATFSIVGALVTFARFLRCALLTLPGEALLGRVTELLVTGRVRALGAVTPRGLAFTRPPRTGTGRAGVGLARCSPQRDGLKLLGDSGAVGNVRKCHGTGVSGNARRVLSL